ncbi:tetratricopeptide (TPR) repeat protein [Kitasatospora sp. GP30]|nr:tetratricopeptide (TPR) repeat protein [Kitasatospora sp. GP30]
MTSASGQRSLAANGHIGLAITGDDSSVTVLNLPEIRSARDVPAPPGAGNLPGPPPDRVVGRSEELRRLRELLTGQRGAAVTPRQAVHGMGGVGKSTLALHYAHTYRNDYTVVWWINATSPSRIDAALADLAVHLHPTLATTTRPDQRTIWATSWLQWHPGWLLIYDNVEEPHHLLGYLGALTGGHHLATSRKAAGWHNVAPSLTLGLLAPQAAADLLCGRAFEGQAPTDRQRHDAEALAADLGYLPLALEQAGAYLRHSGGAVAGYRDSLGLRLDQAAEGSDPQRTIARIWDVTFQAIADRSELAVTVLHTLAWLDPNGFPSTLLAPLTTHSMDLEGALGLLNAYSMVAFDGAAVTVHRLVQMVLRTDPRGRGTAEQVLVHAVYPEGRQHDPQDAQLRVLLPHVFALAAATPPGSHSAVQIQLYTDAAEHLNQQGEGGRALPLHQAVLAHRELVLGTAHADTIASRDAVAVSCRSTDLPRATALLEENLRLRESLLGPMDPATVVNRRNIGTVYRDAGDLQRAVPLLETALEQCMEVLGPADTYTLFSWADLALAYQFAGRIRTAIEMFEINLTQRIMLLGEFHMDTLGSCQYLASAYLQAGNLSAAREFFERTLAGCEHSLGATHWATLTSRDNLAVVHQQAGDPRQAIALLHINVARREEAAGAAHPSTLISRMLLALCYEEAGDVLQTVQLLDTALTDYEQTLGEADHQTIIARGYLAGACYRAGDLSRAVQLYEANFDASVKTLGRRSDEAVTSEINLIAARLSLADSRRPLRRLLGLFRRGRGRR